MYIDIPNNVMPVNANKCRDNFTGTRIHNDRADIHYKIHGLCTRNTKYFLNL